MVKPTVPTRGITDISIKTNDKTRTWAQAWCYPCGYFLRGMFWGGCWVILRHQRCKNKYMTCRRTHGTRGGGGICYAMSTYFYGICIFDMKKGVVRKHTPLATQKHTLLVT